MPKRKANAPTEGKSASVKRRKQSKTDAACQDVPVQSATTQPPLLHIPGAAGTHCPSCGSLLAYYFLNFQEKVQLCCNKECLYPLDSGTDIEELLAPVVADAAAPVASVAAEHAATSTAAKATARTPAARRANRSAHPRSLSKQSAAAPEAARAPAAADAHAVAVAAAPAVPAPAEAAATEEDTLGRLLLPASPLASPRSHRADNSDSSRFSSPFIFGGASAQSSDMPPFDLLDEADDMMQQAGI